MSNNRYKIDFTKNSKKKIDKAMKSDTNLAKKIFQCFSTLLNDPHDISLKTENKPVKVSTEPKNCSRVDGNWRVVWEEIKEVNTILILDLGRHNGSDCVYRHSSF